MIVMKYLMLYMNDKKPEKDYVVVVKLKKMISDGI
jgi:hypothetical protein